jgi:hypothetical protein
MKVGRGVVCFYSGKIRRLVVAKVSIGTGSRLAAAVKEGAVLREGEDVF